MHLPTTFDARATKRAAPDRARARRRGRFGRRVDGALLILAVALLCVLTSPVFAIPSPDVVITFFSNAAQIFGLVTLAVGSALFSRRRGLRQRGRRRTGKGPAVGGSRKLLVALGVASVALLAVNILQWAEHVDSRDARLQTNLARSSIEAGKRVGDVSLKTLSFSAQVDHPLGMTTAELKDLQIGRAHV